MEDVWSVAYTSLKVKVKGQGHQVQKRRFSALSAACVRFMFSKTSLVSNVRFSLYSRTTPRDWLRRTSPK